MSTDRALRILRAHGACATAADAARLLDVLVPLTRAALRVGVLPADATTAPGAVSPPRPARVTAAPSPPAR